MKKMSSSYRLQIIKEVAQKRQMQSTDDPMVRHISELLEYHHDRPIKTSPTFSDNHYDDHIGGWVSNLWDQNK
ncbi:hypothetical protein [Photobacterium carnosum]|uniref:Uncharacterized protein n=1 Tax=Photobacterium carnosum TaxID=2023717 RepID=A0A2N4URU2_9GAMM|nr:hypothetical protein [Photobacterium carnosum]KAE8178176.1 hypothetical protein CIT27_05425 [Photobacterium carnosum]MBY3788782.1 hypothetical protein [Photobacterium carnosum]MCD9493289.1 hypothetical protein [Photobacterium carnosum]MCD9497969.1 hypothetical protein [Photobacterium carnosum]MCD9516576.1 hypothetical protein [Photobacterium carnosum]